MSTLKIINNLPKFGKKITGVGDMAMNQMAIDLERLSKMQVPFDKGHLKASGKHTRVGEMRYQVSYNKEYARFQHEGGDSKRTIKNYSMPGKKKHYLIDPARIIFKNKEKYLALFKKHIKL